MQLDHIAISGQSREAAAAHVEAALGVALRPGGQHSHFATHNHLLGLAEGLYLEAISVDPEAPTPAHPRWFGLDDFAGPPRLTTWICRTADLAALLRDLPEAGEIVALERGDLKWRMAVPTDGRLPFDGCFPALIQWDSPDPPGDSLPASGCALDTLTVSHPEADRLQQRLAPYLDAPRVRFQPGSAHLEARMTGPRGEVTLR
ncbi:VOC family protein [Marinovum sp.]|uniref:VOC family protein n=1 Tax=Marinovum sp. TaxID=2024839 RepID=UPI002B265AE8|nr:VOC family protein [Marinovum sp.]